MLQVEVYLGPSRIHGIGVFTKDLLLPGQIVNVEQWPDTLFLEHEIPDHLRKYAYKLRSGLWLLPCDDLRFLNYSFHPNLVSGDNTDLAICRIEPGTELTINYYDFDYDVEEKLKGEIKYAT